MFLFKMSYNFYALILPQTFTSFNHSFFILTDSLYFRAANRLQSYIKAFAAHLG